MTLALVGTLVAVIGWVLWRQGELFAVAIRGGVPRLVRGRVPPLLMTDFAAACSQMKVERCSIVARRGMPRASLTVYGMSDFQAQRLRNIFQLYPLSLLRSAPSSAPDALTVIRGLFWLGWLFDRR